MLHMFLIHDFSLFLFPSTPRSLFSISLCRLQFNFIPPTAIVHNILSNEYRTASYLLLNEKDFLA